MLRMKSAAFGIAAVLALAGCNQVELARLYLANEGTAAELTQPLPLTLHYRDVGGWVIVPARVNGRVPVEFVLDTGASVMALLADDRMKALEIDLANVHRLGADDDLAAPVGVRHGGMTIDFGGLRLHDQTALAIPMTTLDCGGAREDVPFNGVIGHDLFRRYTVEVNRDRGTVTLHDPSTYRYSGSGRIVPARLENRQPFVDADITPPSSAAYRAHLHVDSGADIDMTLFPASSPSIRPPANGRTHAACFVGGKATYTVGDPVRVALAGAFTTTPVEYARGREVVADGQNGRIGARFLSRFNVVFDYARERIILEPRRTQTAPAPPDRAIARKD